VRLRIAAAYTQTAPTAPARCTRRHLGHSSADGRPGGGFHPTWRGYDSYVGVPYSIDMGCTNSALRENGTAKHGCPDGGAPDQGSPAIPLYNATAPKCAGAGPVCSDAVIQQPADLTQLDEHYVRHVSDFLALHAAGGAREGRPFFAYVPFSHVHVPLSHNPRFQNKSKRNTLFADTLLEMDDTFGRIMARLEQLKLDQDTLVVVVGDNGPVSALRSNPSPTPTPRPRTPQTHPNPKSAATRAP
jgi:arylsulfatase G